MTSLPPNVPNRLQNSPHIVKAYDICLGLEKSLQSIIDKGGAAGNNLVYIRILGYLIHFVPGDQGLETVVQEISSCDGDFALLAVGRMYYDHYIKAFLRANKGNVPTPSNHAASRPSFDTMADMISDTLVTSPQSHATAKKNARIRDGHRCIITGEYEIHSVTRIRELREKLTSNPSLRTGPTDCAHIFPESTHAGIDLLESAKQDHAATMWAIMCRFGHETLPDDLNGPKVHRLENVMTMAPGLHRLFDQLMIWLVATSEENKYKLDAASPFPLRGYPEYVTFTTPDPVKFPVPSPAYLAIHAACAKVAHFSGAAECIDRFYRDMEDIATLDPDGASADLLEEAIRGLEVSGFEAACML